MSSNRLMSQFAPSGSRLINRKDTELRSMSFDLCRRLRTTA